MSIPTTALKFPLEGKPIAADGNWTPVWQHALQGLFTRVGAVVAPSNLQLASAISAFIAGPATSVDGDIASFSGTSGKILKDSGVNISTIVTGPASSVTGDIALFNSLTGTAIQDSGVQLTALATNNSPSLTGTPTAPTAAPGTNTTQIATTAFVATSFAPLASPNLTGTPTVPTAGAGTNTTQAASTAFVTAAVAKAGTTSSSFSANGGGTVQSIPNNAFTKLTLGTAVFNNGSNYSTANSRWTPPAGRLVMLTGQVTISTTANTLTIVSVYKNGAELLRGGQMVAGGINSGSVTVTCIDVPNGTDYYELWCFQNTGGALNTVSSSAVTWFQGTSIQS